MVMAMQEKAGGPVEITMCGLNTVVKKVIVIFYVYDVSIIYLVCHFGYCAVLSGISSLFVHSRCFGRAATPGFKELDRETIADGGAPNNEGHFASCSSLCYRLGHGIAFTTG